MNLSYTQQLNLCIKETQFLLKTNQKKKKDFHEKATVWLKQDPEVRVPLAWWRAGHL